jgi:hypothetical protein
LLLFLAVKKEYPLFNEISQAIFFPIPDEAPVINMFLFLNKICYLNNELYKSLKELDLNKVSGSIFILNSSSK